MGNKNDRNVIMKRFVVKISQLLGLYQFCVKIDSFFRTKAMNRSFKKYGLEALQRCSDAFESTGSKMFLVFGTLLGAWRDHKFIPFDNDLDVGVIYSERPNRIIQIMKEYGFSLKRQIFIANTDIITEEQYYYQGVQIDVFYFFEDGEDTYDTYVARRHETKDWREANETDGFPCVKYPCAKCNFVKIDFMGLQVYVPSKTDIWCKDVYGEDYMTPVKNWTKGERKTKMQKTTQRLYRRYF